MKLKFSIIQLVSYSAILLFALPLKAQVTIGAQKAPHSYSVLELMSTKGGLRLPMLNTSDRDALNLTSDSTEASGLFIYNTDMDCVEFWSNGAWTDICSAGALPIEKVMNPIILANLPVGSGIVSGRTLFDIDVTDGGSSSCGTLADRAANKADFSKNSTYDYVYTTLITQTVQNVRYVIQDPEGVLQVLQPQPLSGTLVPDTLGPGDSTPALTLKFKTDLHLPGSQPLIVGRKRNSAARVFINIIYNNGISDVKVVETVSIQDCSCGSTVRTVGGGRLTFMCYNLGAADTVKTLSPSQQAAYVNPAEEYGDMYQWGRSKDGHQLRTSQSYPTNSTAAGSGPVSGSDLNGNGQVASTSDAFNKFIKNNDATTYNDWRIPQVDTLWYNNGKKTVNDPCPAGWRVPTTTEWQSIVNGSVNVASISDSYNSISGNRWQLFSSTNSGYLVIPLSSNSSPALFLPAAGYRSSTNSVLNSVGSTGNYWSSSVNGTSAYYLSFTTTTVSSGNSTNRALGGSVRCVEDQ